MNNNIKEALWNGYLCLMLGLAIFATVFFASYAPAKALNTDPRVDWVLDPTPHICDGANMIYTNSGVILNDPRCQK